MLLLMMMMMMMMLTPIWAQRRETCRNERPVHRGRQEVENVRKAGR